MEVRAPKDVSGIVGASQTLPRELRESISVFLSGGEPLGEVVRVPCPVCGTRIDTRPVTVSEVTWSRLVTHLVTAHDAWWPELTELHGFLGGRTGSGGETVGSEVEQGDGETPVVDFSDWTRMDPDVESVGSFLDPIPEARPRPVRPPLERQTNASAKSTPRSAAPRRLTNGHGHGHRHQESTDDRVTMGAAAAEPSRRPPTTEHRKDRMLEAEAGSVIASTYGITPALASEIVRVAKAIGAHPFDLANLISFESAGTFSPKVAGPRSTGATGLIQITESTARWLGTTTTELAKLDALQQMPWVQTYLDKVRNGRPLDNAHKMAMAVFYPKAIDWPATQRFPPEVTKRNTHRLADGTVFPIRTPADYLTLMKGRSKLPSGEAAGPISPDIEGGMLDTVLNWMTGIFGPGSEVATTPSATWDLSPGVSAILQGSDGKTWQTGPVPPGTYRLVVSGLPPSPSVQLQAGLKYRASSIGQLFQVG